MLKMKHREEATSTERDEQRIREDERRRVMDELRGDDAPADEDWRTTPPAFDEPRYDDPARDGVAADPRTWDVPDDREELGSRGRWPPTATRSWNSARGWSRRRR